MNSPISNNRFSLLLFVVSVKLSVPFVRLVLVCLRRFSVLLLGFLVGVMCSFREIKEKISLIPRYRYSRSNYY